MHHTTRGLALGAGLVFLTGAQAAAQSFLDTNSVVVANVGGPVPDTAGVAMPNFAFGGSGNFDTPVLDASGNVFFRGRFVDTPTTILPYNDRAYFYGNSPSNLRMVVRGGEQAPGQPAGVLLRTTTGTTVSLSGSYRISPNGTTLWGATFWDSIGTGGITAANDEAFFGGPASGAPSLQVQQGSPAPGTVGATYAQAFSSFSQQSNGINDQGRLYFSGSLTGGDTSTTTGSNNQSGWFAGLPAGIEMIQRKGSPVNGVPGAIAIDTSATMGFVSQMNSSGAFLYEVVMSNTQGTATVTNDRAYLVHTPGVGSTVLVREGDVAPGCNGATFNAETGDAWSAGLGGNAFNRNGQTVFSSTLRGGDVSGTTNNVGLFMGSPGNLQLVVREGMNAPGTDAQFQAFQTSNAIINNNGQVMFQGILTGGTSTTANDTGVWMGTPGNLVLVAREGDAAPSSGGGTLASLSGTSIYFNDQGRVMFTNSPTGGTVTGLWYIWDAVGGIQPLTINGSQYEVAPGVFKTLQSVSTTSFNNTDGASLIFGHTGKIALKLGFTDATGAVVIVTLPTTTPATTYCFGDGSGTACPCGNSGAAGNGCANSVNASGANLAASGVASLAADSFLLSGSGMPNSSVLYFQGTTQVSSAFGDGLRCAGGSVVRLGAKFNTAGASVYPAAGELAVSVKAGIAAPSTHTYQAWYRNADPAFCTAAVFNLSNGVEVTWVP